MTVATIALLIVTMWGIIVCVSTWPTKDDSSSKTRVDVAPVAATVVRSFPRQQQAICQYCNKPHVSGLENCPNCGASYKE